MHGIYSSVALQADCIRESGLQAQEDLAAYFRAQLQAQQEDNDKLWAVRERIHVRPAADHCLRWVLELWPS
jgi:hypothetical protein